MLMNRLELYCKHVILAEDKETIMKSTEKLIGITEALLEWIDAVPVDMELPVMPGIDRDYVEETIADAKEEVGHD